MINIPFNKPHVQGNELKYFKDLLKTRNFSGNGKYTGKVQKHFERKYKIKKALLTTSCTAALDMAAILADISPGDEVIIPTYTFTSTANAFVLRGAKIIFADSEKRTPNLDVSKIEKLITKKTKVIVVVHYAGVSCDMGKVMLIAKKHGLLVIEDAAQAIDSFYKNKRLGTIGDLASFSFHETKNIHAGEGGLLAINNPRFMKRGEIIWEKGTNRAEFFRGEVNKYEWKDLGSSFLISEINAAFLYAQLQDLKKIQIKRKKSWDRYQTNLKELADQKIISLPFLPSYSRHNAHLSYILCRNMPERSKLIFFLRANGVLSVFHYLCLHKSSFHKKREKPRKLKHAERYEQTLLRLPLFVDLKLKEVDFVCNLIKEFYSTNS